MAADGFENWLVLDCETTGIHPEHDEIIELAVVDMRGVRVFESLIQPTKSVGDSERVHGISDEMLKTAPSLNDLLSAVQALFTDRILVAHRADFDRNFCSKSGFVGDDQTFVDTAKLAQRAFGRTNLRALAEALSFTLPSHRAGPDAVAARDLLEKCIERLAPRDADELLKLASNEPFVRSSHCAILQDSAKIRITYQPEAGRTWTDDFEVSRVDLPYIEGSRLGRRGKLRLRGDRIVSLERAFF